MSVEKISSLIRDVKDFPKPGIVFKDIMPLLQDPDGLRMTVDLMVDLFTGIRPDVVVGAEARGFLFSAPMAYKLSCGLVPVRKPGKLPSTTKSVTYDLEYGTDTLCIHADAITPGQKVLVIDDVLATGGTISSTCKLVEELGGNIVGCGFLMELDFLHGRDKLQKYNVQSLLHVLGE